MIPTQGTIFAWTDAGGSYPAYFNATADGDHVILTIRSEPTSVNGSRVCGVTCHPHTEHCNNYCNQAPEKGLMAARPLSHSFDLFGFQLSHFSGSFGALITAMIQIPHAANNGGQSCCMGKIAHEPERNHLNASGKAFSNTAR